MIVQTTRARIVVILLGCVGASCICAFCAYVYIVRIADDGLGGAGVKCLLELARSGSEKAAALFGCSARRRKTEHLLDVLTHGHRAQNVQENEGALVVIFAGQIAMAQALDPRDGQKGKASYYASIETISTEYI